MVKMLAVNKAKKIARSNCSGNNKLLSESAFFPMLNKINFK